MPRDPRSDPFTPGFGNLPLVFAGRNAEFDDLTRMVDRLVDGVYEQPRMLTGDRGMGKTSLLLHFEQEQLEAGRWVVRASATRDHAVLVRLCRGLAETLWRHDVAQAANDAIKEALRRLAGVSISNHGVSVDLQPTTDPARTGDELRALLEAVARLARDHRTALVVLIDEAQNIDLPTLGQLFYALQEVLGVKVVARDHDTGALLRDTLPLAVVVAGLPGLVTRLRKAGSTFGERSKPVPLSPLERADVLVALRGFAREGGAAFDADAADLVADAAGGYPYFLHVVGSHVWRAGTGDVITADDARTGTAQARPYLNEFYRQRLTEVGELQRAYLIAAASLAPAERTPGAIAAMLGRTSAQLGSTQHALVETHGLLRSDGSGRLAFTLPGMDNHLADDGGCGPPDRLTRG